MGNCFTLRWKFQHYLRDGNDRRDKQIVQITRTIKNTRNVNDRNVMALFDPPKSNLSPNNI